MGSIFALEREDRRNKADSGRYFDGFQLRAAAEYGLKGGLILRLPPIFMEIGCLEKVSESDRPEFKIFGKAAPPRPCQLTCENSSC